MCDIRERYEIVKDGVVYYVQRGYCDDIPTKWITLKPWYDGVIFVCISNGEFVYKDSRGMRIMVYEKSDDEWANY